MYSYFLNNSRLTSSSTDKSIKIFNIITYEIKINILEYKTYYFEYQKINILCYKNENKIHK